MAQRKFSLSHTTRKLLLIVALSGSAAFVHVSASNAASPELSFYPAKTWEMAEQKTDQISTNGKTCRIENEFNNGFIIGVEGNRKWVQAVTVDFRQDVFKKGQAYDAVLSVPGQNSQNLNAEAQADSTLLLPLAGKKQLYKAMRDAGVFDLELDGNSFRFYLTGFAAPATTFETCMAGSDAMPRTATNKLRAQSSSLINAQSAPDLIAEESITIKPNASAMDYESKEAARLTEMRETLEKETIDAEAALQAQLDEESKAKDAVKKTLVERKIEPVKVIDLDLNTDKESAITETPQNIVSEPIVVDFTDATPDETALDEPDPVVLEEPSEDVLEKIELKNETKRVISSDIKVNKHTQKMEADLSKAGLKEDLMEEGSRDAPRGDLMPMGGDTFVDVQAPKNVALVGGMDANSARTISALERNVVMLERENLALNEELKSALKASEEERLMVSSENWNLERATMRFNEAERQIQRLGLQLQQERAKCDLDTQELEAMLFDPQVTSDKQLAQVAELRRAIEQAEREIEEQRMRYEERIRLLEGQR